MDEKPTKQPTPPVITTPSGDKKPAPVKLIAIIAGAVVAVGVVVLVLFLTVFAGPSKADFKAALDETKEVRNSYQDLSNTVRTASRVSSIEDEDELNEKYDELRTQFDAYKKAAGELEGEKAFRDSEAGKSYDAFKKQNETFAKYVESLLGSYKEVGLVSIKCKGVQNSVSGSSALSDPNAIAKFDEAMKPCNDALDAAQNVPNAHLKNLAGKTKAFYGEIRASLVTMSEAYQARNSSALLSASRELREKTTEFSSATRDIAKELTDEGEAAEVNEQINDLGEILTKKANK